MRYAALLVLLSVVAALPASAAPGASKSATPLSTEGVLLRETSAGDLIADALRRAGQADAALVSACQFRVDTIGPGKITGADVAGLLVKPDRNFVVSNVTGKGLRAALERSLSRVPEESAYFLQVSGLRITFDPEAPSGHRVKSVALEQGQDLQDARTYRVAMPDDLARGGSGYFTIGDFSESSILPGTGATMAEALSQFLEATPNLDYSRLSRLSSGGEAP